MNTSLFIAVIVETIAVLIMIYFNYKSLQVAKIANDSSYESIKKYTDLMNETRNLKELNRKLDERYEYLYEQYRFLQSEYDSLAQKYVKKTGEEPEN